MTQGILAIFGVLFGIACLGGSLYLYCRHWNYKHLRPLADAYGAELNLTRGRAQFFVHKTLVTIRPKVYTESSWLSPPSFELRASLPESAPACRIRPLKFWDPVRRWIGHGLVTGEKAFDDMFFVQSQDPQQLRQILDISAQAALLSLYGGLIQLQVRGGVLKMVARQPVLNVAAQGIVLTERFLGLGSEGIEFGEQQASCGVTISDDTACPVCGDQLVHKVVYCRQCQMPHHADCWNYSEGCAIYGCGGRRKSKRIRHRQAAL